MKRAISLILSVAACAVATGYADDFGTGTNQFSIVFTEIGHPGNPADSTGFGAVDHTYRIGTYEVSIEQFYKARAADSRISNGNENYWNDGTRTVGTGAPATFCNWFEAARFANWLTSGDAYAGAYQFDTNGVLLAVDRDAAMLSYGTVYALPSEDEWYKAAYYKPVNDGSYAVYSNGSTAHQNQPLRGTTNGWNYAEWVYTPALEVHYVNSTPNYTWTCGYGGQEQNGTYDMDGNVWEWCESAFDGSIDDPYEDRVIRGASYYEKDTYLAYDSRHPAYNPTNQYVSIGLRIVALPAVSYNLDIALTGNGSVNVTNGMYVIGTNLSLVATPDTNWLFMGWTGDLAGDYTTANTNLLMDANKSITATFSDDADGDGLLNVVEEGLGTDPRNADSDGDAMPDGWEAGYGLNATTNDASLDFDADGLTNLAEFVLGTIPTNTDSDADMMTDGWEVSYGLDATTNDAALDFDADGLTNLAEFILGTIPTNTDSDADGLSDAQEVEAGLDPLVSNAGSDSDGDGLSDADEVNTYSTDPLNADTDFDVIPDGWEVGYGLGALTNSALADADGDERADLYEFAMGGDPTNALDAGVVPYYLVVGEGGTNRLDYIHARRTNAVSLGLSYEVEQGLDGLVWTNVGYTVTGTSGLTNGFESVTSRLDTWTSSNLYLRVAVSTSNAVVYSAVTLITELDLWAGGYGLYGTNAVASADPDGDGLDNEAELNAGTDPTLADTDGDSLTDGAEVNTYGTNPIVGDSDGDTFDDGVEVANGGDPLVSDLWRVDYIRNHGAAYDLYSTNSVLDLGMGQAVFTVSNGEATLSLQLEQSDDLTTWTNAGDAVIWSIPVDTNKAFYRVRSGN